MGEYEAAHFRPLAFGSASTSRTSTTSSPAVPTLSSGICQPGTAAHRESHPLPGPAAGRRGVQRETRVPGPRARGTTGRESAGQARPMSSQRSGRPRYCTCSVGAPRRSTRSVRTHPMLSPTGGPAYHRRPGIHDLAGLPRPDRFRPPAAIRRVGAGSDYTATPPRLRGGRRGALGLTTPRTACARRSSARRR